MPIVTSYAPGTPSWVDLTTSDPDAAGAFYGALLGWDVLDPGPQFGGYRRLLRQGHAAAGLMGAQEGMPTVWTTYVATADAGATAEAVRAGGGSVLVEPMPVHDLGTMAVFLDPSGAAFGAWQAGTFAGAEVVNEPGALVWNELATRDPQGAAAFYGAVFGWTARTEDMGGTAYTTFELDGRPVGGMMEIGADWPPEVPSYWAVYFAVEDCDAAVAQATGDGATLLVPPRDIPVGRFAVLTDPQGAPFSLIAMAS